MKSSLGTSRGLVSSFDCGTVASSLGRYLGPLAYLRLILQTPTVSLEIRKGQVSINIWHHIHIHI